MADLLLVDGDLQPVNTLVSGIEQTAQRIRIRLLTFAASIEAAGFARNERSVRNFADKLECGDPEAEEAVLTVEKYKAGILIELLAEARQG